MEAERAITAHERAGHSWLEAGDGPATILFLHPIVGTSVYWTPQLLALSDEWRCVAWDAPGYVGTSSVGPPLAEAVTAHLVDFLDVAGIDRAHVVGLSLGGMFALHAATDHHDRFDRLVVADTSAAFGIDPDAWLADWLGDLRDGAALPDVVAESITSITTAPIDAELVDAIVASFDRVSVDAFEAASRYIAFHDVRGSLGVIPNEVLVVVGEHDGETPPEYSEELASLIPRAKLEQLAGVGHLTSIEAPVVFAAMLRSFLDA